MSEQLRLMAVLAHPDDESLGVGGTLARYSAEGVATYPDHIAISQLTAGAVAAAAAGGFATGEPHRVAKLYYVGLPPQIWALYQAAFKKLVSVVDGVERHATPWPD